MAKTKTRYNGSAPCFMVLPKEEKDVDPKREKDMEDHVPTIDLISRINNVQDSLAKKEEPLHVDLAEQNGAAHRDAKVMEMAKRFGGAKQKCLQRIRSNLHIGKAKESSEEKEEVGESGGTVEEQNGRAKYENCKSVVNDDEQFRTNRSGCLPAIIYLTTPILVTLFAWILHCWLGWQSTSSVSAEE